MGLIQPSSFFNKQPQAAEASLPNHVAFIMDGNGRWATRKGLPRSLGHKKGAETVHKVVDYCLEFGIKYLTLYAFSSENWKRSDDEIHELMELLRSYLKNELGRLTEKGIRLKVIGDISKLDDDIQEQINEAEQYSAGNQALNLQIALNYGSQQEIAMACSKLIEAAANTKKTAITPEDITALLYTAGVPDPDLLIRTGGEHRLSNFLLWQMAYTELFFCDSLWPDFDKKDFELALQDFGKRERRFGGV